MGRSCRRVAAASSSESDAAGLDSVEDAGEAASGGAQFQVVFHSPDASLVPPGRANEGEAAKSLGTALLRGRQEGIVRELELGALLRRVPSAPELRVDVCRNPAARIGR